MVSSDLVPADCTLITALVTVDILAIDVSVVSDAAVLYLLNTFFQFSSFSCSSLC